MRRNLKTELKKVRSLDGRTDAGRCASGTAEVREYRRPGFSHYTGRCRSGIDQTDGHELALFAKSSRIQPNDSVWASNASLGAAIVSSFP